MTTDAARSVWEELGTTPVINANGHVTVLGGSSISPSGQHGPGYRPADGGQDGG